MDWFDILAVQGTLKSLLQHHSSKASILLHSAFFMVQFSHPYLTIGKTIASTTWASLVAQMVKNPLAMQELQESSFDPWVRKIPWRRTWQSTPVFLPGESHGQRSLAGYSSWDCKKSDKTNTFTFQGKTLLASNGFQTIFLAAEHFF